MTTLNRARVCTIGTQDDMLRLCRTLLNNCDWYGERYEDEPGLPLEKLIGIVARHGRLEGGELASFSYDMVTERPYGDAWANTCRLKIKRHATGLWTALFSYDSETRFQPEDWLKLHQQMRMLPMMAQYANDDFGLEKGMKLFVSGKIRDDWRCMGETWLWLMARYEEGFPPEEAVARLRKLRVTMEREEFDLTVGEMLCACLENLEDVRDSMKDPQRMTMEMQRMRTAKDFDGLFSMYLQIVEAELWDAAHVERHLACLEATYREWVQAEGQDA